MPRTTDAALMADLAAVTKHDFVAARAAPMPAKLTDHIFLGSQREATDVERLKELGIRAVLNCAAGFVRTGAGFYGDGFEYLELHADDVEGYQLLDKHFKDAFAFVEWCVKTDRPVLIHCVAGINRSSTIAIACMLMLDPDAKLIATARHVHSRRHVILLNRSFRSQLIVFARKNKKL